MVTLEDVREITAGLERSYEVFVRDRVKFRVGRIVFVAMSRGERMLGFGFPKDERAALPKKLSAAYFMHSPSVRIAARCKAMK